MTVTTTVKVATVHNAMVWGTPAAPLFRLRGTFWATSRRRNPELYLYRHCFELQVPGRQRYLVHRVPYNRVAAVELVAGRFFTDVVFTTHVGTELVAPGIRNRDLIPAKALLAGVVTTRPTTACPA